VIRVEDFSKSYGIELAVNALSFSVNAGEILGLLGPNGAGKTTTLRTLAGIAPPSAGRLTVAGADVVRQSIEAKTRLAFIPDDPRLFDALTVWEHLEFTAAAYRIRNFESSALTLLKQFELVAKKDSLAQELSRGMRQKLAIACGYLHEPVALLFDEPLTGLDPHSIEILQASIHAHAQNGAAVLISSHLLTNGK
jgi:ABC-2 type transport system ATP-binding protein